MNEIDFWSDDQFTDTITSALIATYETQISYQIEGMPPLSNKPGLHTIAEADLIRVRKHGLFVPHRDRPAFIDGFSFAQDGGAPQIACLAMGPSRGHVDAVDGEPAMETYCRIQYMRRLERLPADIRRTIPGIPYESIALWPQDKGGIHGLRLFFVLRPDGTAKIQYAHWRERNSDFEETRDENGFVAALQFYHGIRNDWTITALDGRSKVTVAAYPESVKSVLYARSVPLTESGRKRPILHLVEAHKRRMKSGVEIDISEFLRGTREVQMDGIRYIVAPSKVLQAQLDAQKAS